MGDLNISRQMADMLASSPSIKKQVDEILKDGKVDGNDETALLNLRGQMETLAKRDDGKIDANEDSLIDALDSTGWFGTNEEVVAENLRGIQALQQKYAADPNSVNFANGLMNIKTQDGLGGLVGGKQERVLRIRDLEVPDSADTTAVGSQSPSVTQGTTTSGTSATTTPPPVANTPADVHTDEESPSAPVAGNTGDVTEAPTHVETSEGAAPPSNNAGVGDTASTTPADEAASTTQQELTALAQADTQKLTTSVNILQSRLTSDPQIRANIQAKELQYESGSSLATNSSLGITDEDRAKVAAALGVEATDAKVNDYIATVLDVSLNKKKPEEIQPPNAELKGLIDSKFKAYAEKKTNDKIATLSQYITDFKASPNDASAIRNLYNWIATPPDSDQFLSKDPAFNKAFGAIQADIQTAHHTSELAKDVSNNIENKYYKTPSDVTKLQADLAANSKAVFETAPVTEGEPPEAGPLIKALEQTDQLATQLEALKKSDAKLYAQHFGNLDPASLRQTAAQLAPALAEDENGNRPPITEETLRQVARLKSYTDQFAGVMKNLPTEANPALKEIKETYDSQSSSVRSALYAVKNDIEYKSAVKAELQMAQTELTKALASPTQLPADVRASLTEQLNAVNASLTAIENNQPLPSDEASVAALGKVTQAINAAKQEPPQWYTPPLWGFGSFCSPWGSSDPLSLGLSSPSLGTDSLLASGSSPALTLGGIGGLTTGGMTSRFGANVSGFNFSTQLNQPASTLPTSKKPQAASIQEALMSQATQSAQKGNFEAIEQARPELKAQLDQAKKILDDPAISAEVKTHLNNSIYALRLDTEGKGDTLIDGIKASDLKNDIGLISKLYTFEQVVVKDGKPRNQGLDKELNNQLMEEAVLSLRDPHAIASGQRAAGLDVMFKELTSPDKLQGLKEEKLNNADKELLDLKTDVQASQASKAALGKDIMMLYTQLNSSTNPAEKAKAADIATALAEQGIDIKTGNLSVNDLQTAVNGLSADKMAVLSGKISSVGQGLKANSKEDQQRIDELNGRFLNLQTQFNAVQQKAEAVTQTYNNQVTQEIDSLKRLRDTAPANVKPLYSGMIAELEGLQAKMADPNYLVNQADLDRYQLVAEARLTIERGLQTARRTGGQAIKDIGPLLQRMINQFNPPPGGGATMVFDRAAFNDLKRQIMTVAGSTTAAADVATINQDGVDATTDIVAAVDESNRFKIGGRRNRELGGGFGIQSTGPGGTVPGGTVPGGTVPGGTVPGGTVPGGTVPGGTGPGGTGPGGTVPWTLPVLTVSDPNQNTPVTISTSSAPPRADGTVEPTNPFAEFAPEVARLETMSTTEAEAWADDFIEAFGNINSSFANVEQFSANYAQAMAPLMDQMELILDQQQETVNELNEISMDKAKLSSEARALVDKADELATAILSPKPGMDGKEALSDLLGKFLENIRNLDFETRKIVMAQFAKRLVNNMITKMYDEKRLENAKYHQKSLDQFKEHMKEGIEKILAQAEVQSKANSGQDATASGGRGGQTGAATSISGISDDFLKNDMSAFLEPAVQDGVLSRVQKQKILQAIFDGSSVTGQAGIMSMLSRFQEMRSSIITQ